MSYAPRTNQSSTPSDPPVESTGPIASDSLAADSLRSGGDFAANDSSTPQPLGVKGASSTLANTDTSGAVPLHPARSGAAREREDEKGLGSDEKGASGLKYPDADGQPEFPGTTTSEGYTGGPSSGQSGQGYATGAAEGASDFGGSTTGSGVDTSSTEGISGKGGDSGTSGSAGSKSSGAQGSGETSYSSTGQGLGSDQTSGSGADTSRASGTASKSTSGGDAESGASTGTDSSSGPTAGAGIRPYVPEGPTYTGRVAGTIGEQGDLKPKGENLTEGDIPQTKTFIGDVGGQHDPGRLAEQNFEKTNAAVAGSGVGGRSYQGEGEDGKGESGGQYDVLGSERAP